jgi:hypothetical protein
MTAGLAVASVAITIPSDLNHLERGLALIWTVVLVTWFPPD